MDRALGAIVKAGPPAPVDDTDWLAVLEAAAGRAGSAQARAYYARPARKLGTADRLARARAGLAILECLPGDHRPWLVATICTPAHKKMKVACSGPAGFARLLFAAAADDALAAARAAANAGLTSATAPAILDDVVRCANAVRAALPWKHGESVMPAQLGPVYQAKVRAAAHLLQYATLQQKAPDPTMTTTQSQLAVAVLQLLVQDTKQHCPGAAAWAQTRLRVELAHAWASHRADPRVGAATTLAIKDVTLYATIKALCAAVPADQVPRSATVALAALDAIVGARTTELSVQAAAVADAADAVAPLDLAAAAKLHSCLAATQTRYTSPQDAVRACLPAPPPIAW